VLLSYGHEFCPQRLGVAAADRELIGHHGIAGQSNDSVDVGSRCCDRSCDSADLYWQQFRSEHGDDLARHAACRLRLNNLELDVDVLLPSEQQQLFEEIASLRNLDDKAQRKSTTNDYLLDVLYECFAVSEKGHDPGCNPRAIFACDLHQHGLIRTHTKNRTGLTVVDRTYCRELISTRASLRVKLDIPRKEVVHKCQ